jgi:hypothetical protein
MVLEILALLIALLGVIITGVAGFLSLRTKRQRWWFIIATVAGIVILIAGGGFWALLRWLSPDEVKVVVHVAGPDGASVSGARVLFFVEGGPYRENTDSDGVAVFTLKTVNSDEAHMVVETDQFAIHDEVVKLSGDQTINVSLKPRSGTDRRVIVRAVNDASNNPIQGANVVIIAAGNVFTQSTDSNGLSKFTLNFTGDTVEVDMSVSSLLYNINNQKVTLRPDEVQDARLNPTTQEIRVTGVSVPETTSPTPIGQDVLTFGQTVSGEIASAAEADRYTFSANAGNVVLIKIGKVEGDFWPQIRLFDPDGNLIDSPKGGAVSAELNVTLPVDGIYTILVDDGFNGTWVGKYSLHLEKIK